MFNRNANNALAADYLRWAVGGDEFRMRSFEVTNLVHRTVVLFIRYDRSILLIIRCAPAFDLLAEFIVGIDIFSHYSSVPFSVAAVVFIIHHF